MKYLTQLLNKRVIEPDGSSAGRITDAIADLEGRLPTLSAVVVRTRRGERDVPYSEILIPTDPAGLEGSGTIHGDVQLKRPLADIPPYQRLRTDLSLRTEVLNRQIVDVQDFRVVRVSDIRLTEVAGKYAIVGVDASLRATLRQFGSISGPIENLARRIGKPLRSNLIAWDDVETLEPEAKGGRIRLKVSHDKLARLHPADIADIVEQLSPRDRADVIGALDTETAADAIAETEPSIQVEIMGQLDDAMAAEILVEMEPDEAADLLVDLPDARSDALLEQMEPEDAADVKELMAYDEDTAGGLMTTELVSIPKYLTCDQTIERLRELAPRAETIYYVYVVDDEDRLVGVLSLRDLIISPPSTPIAEIMVRNVIHVYVEDHADQVAQVVGRYSLLAIPVVDAEEKLVGIVTVDDALARLLPPEKRRRVSGNRFSEDE